MVSLHVLTSLLIQFNLMMNIIHGQPINIDIIHGQAMNIVNNSNQPNDEHHSRLTYEHR